ncbi:hypothetical protein JJV70_02480 [Streptomyces sp. JJ66]|uniref:hypothetical protein n=1 Tax=Streptomyces sp. JJ66 TaxID=2803843 RepID=UPI001C5905D6|nr:hypothetical protein [Streptomyces sp. JJ66]MBW1600988.1 hypothetical protein [Streptomyces sp. JJ66]
MLTLIPPFQPPPTEQLAMDAGVHWDAVRATADIAALALPELDEQQCGSVICDGYGALVYWLVPVHAADAWTLPTVRVLSARSCLVVPAPHRVTPPGNFWMRPFARDHYLTEPTALHQALSHALTTAQPATDPGRRP